MLCAHSNVDVDQGWIMISLLLDCFCTAAELALDTLWTVSALHLDYASTAFGLCLYCSWTILHVAIGRGMALISSFSSVLSWQCLSMLGWYTSARFCPYLLCVSRQL